MGPFHGVGALAGAFDRLAQHEWSTKGGVFMMDIDNTATHLFLYGEKARSADRSWQRAPI